MVNGNPPPPEKDPDLKRMGDDNGSPKRHEPVPPATPVPAPEQSREDVVEVLPQSHNNDIFPIRHSLMKYELRVRRVSSVFFFFFWFFVLL